MSGACEDCGMLYNHPGWVDVNIPDEQWSQIAEPGDILCLYCMTVRLEHKGLTEVPVMIMSGPYSNLSAKWFDEGWVKGNQSGLLTAAEEVHRKRLALLLSSTRQRHDEALRDLEKALRALGGEKPTE